LNLTYLICRCHGFETKLLPANFIRELAMVNHLRDLLERLSQTSYGPRLKDVRNVWDIERVFAEELMDRFYRLLRIAPEGAIYDFLKTYFRKYEIQNLIWIIRMKRRKAPEDEIRRLLLPTEKIGEIKFEPLIKAENLGELLTLLGRKEYREAVKYGEENILLIESILKKIYYQQLIKCLSKIPTADRSDIRDIITLDIDLSNLKLCILALSYNYDKPTVRRLLIRNPRGIPLWKFIVALRDRSPQRFIEHFPKYRGFLEAVLSGEEWRADVEYLRTVRRRLQLKKIEKYISFLYVVKYVIDLETEYRNLRSIALSIHHNLPLDARRRLLILP